jgi:hypothetical protein
LGSDILDQFVNPQELDEVVDCRPRLQQVLGRWLGTAAVRQMPLKKRSGALLADLPHSSVL